MAVTCLITDRTTVRLADGSTGGSIDGLAQGVLAEVAVFGPGGGGFGFGFRARKFGSGAGDGVPGG
ncbi:hypothetical protein OG440_18305 [Streptomyces sp. NBC_00637]